jgi:hypothetical protein
MNEEAKSGLKFLDIDDEAGGILAYSVTSGKITEDELAPVWARFEDAKAEDRKIRIYAEMSGIPSASGGVVIDKFKHLGSILSTMERMAIVGDAGWMGLYAKVVDPITKFDIRHFTTDQKEQAQAWIYE